MENDYFKVIILSYNGIAKLLNLASKSDFVTLDIKNQSLNLINNFSECIFTIKLPLIAPIIKEEENLNNYISRYIKPSPYIIILIQAGQSVLGYYENKELLKHKVIRKYMIRKKQGKAQIYYGKKSSVGARLRLSQSIKFFEEITSKLNEWNIKNNIEKILLSCPKRLLAYWFKSKNKPIFNKNDARLCKIPLYVNTPNLKELKKINYKLNHGELKIFSEDYYKYIDVNLEQSLYNDH